MEDYMLVIEGDGRSCTQEEMQNKLEKYGHWMEKYSKTGNYVSGAPFKPEGVYIDINGVTHGSGDFLNPETIVGGYVLLKATDLQGAVAIAKECPLINPMRIQVRPFHYMK